MGYSTTKLEELIDDLIKAILGLIVGIQNFQFHQTKEEVHLHENNPPNLSHRHPKG